MSVEAGVAPPGLQEAEANARWLADHPAVVRAHYGEWLCIVDQRVVVAEPDWQVFIQRVQPYQNCGGMYVLRVPTREELELAHPRL